MACFEEISCIISQNRSDGNCISQYYWSEVRNIRKHMTVSQNNIPAAETSVMVGPMGDHCWHPLPQFCFHRPDQSQVVTVDLVGTSHRSVGNVYSFFAISYPEHTTVNKQTCYFTFDVSMTVYHWYNTVNNQLDATITIYWWFQSAHHVSGDNYAHPQEH